VVAGTLDRSRIRDHTRRRTGVIDHTVVHFEIPADDPERAAQFYRELFGWEISRWEGSAGGGAEYWMVKTVPTDAAGQPTRPGVNGGLMRRMFPGQAPVNYVGVASVDDCVRRAEQLGAKVNLERRQPMPDKVKPIPDGYHAVTPYLSIQGAAAAIAFYKAAFGAKEVMRMPGPGGTIGHAEIDIGGSRIMLADEHPEMNFRGPKSFGGTAVHLHVYVPDVDKVVQQAMAAGAKGLRPVTDEFYGDRVGSLEDPFGHVWHVATHKEDLSMAELSKRAAARAAAAAKT
jgi:PhnB protein